MRETASLLAALVDRKERIFPILSNGQNKMRHKYLICASMDSKYVKYELAVALPVCKSINWLSNSRVVLCTWEEDRH